MTELERTNLKKCISMVHHFFNAVNVGHDPHLLQKRQQAYLGLQHMTMLSEMKSNPFSCTVSQAVTPPSPCGQSAPK